MRRLNLAFLLVLAGGLLAACGPADGGDSGGTSGPPRNAVTISMVYGSEKRSWLEAVTREFNDRQVQTADGRPIYVELTAMGSADSMHQILAGTITPTVWSPASTILVPLANDRWAQANGGEELVGDAPPLVLSPVVIAMWRPMAEALGWPQQPLGWADIAELAGNRTSWSEYGHPEWGSFQFGHTHPDYSNSGIASIIATAYAATGKTRGLSLDDVRQPGTAEFLARVERGVIHYGESTGFFADQMFNRGPSYLSAAVLYENLVVESYNREKYPSVPFPVVAIYPSEGTFYSDHPYAILNAPWVSGEQRAAAETYRDYLLERPQQERALQFGFRPANINVPIGAPLTAANGVDPQQPKTTLEVPSARVTDAVQQLWVQNKKRVDVVVVLDRSGSMSEEGRLEQAKAALVEFIGQLSDEDGLGIIVFSNEAAELTPLGLLGPRRQQVIEQVQGLFPGGQTRLMDTIAEAYARMQQLPAGDRIRAIVVLSDGADNQSQITPDELASRLGSDQEGSSIKVFTIAYGTNTDVDFGLLERIAAVSGAKAYRADPAKIQQVYRDISTFF